jgi:putative redox protein
MYADRKGWKIYSLTVDLRIVRSNDGMRIERALTIDGLGDDQKARLAEIAEKTPVTLTLKGGIPIHTTLA